jgi:hypothetical protein
VPLWETKRKCTQETGQIAGRAVVTGHTVRRESFALASEAISWELVAQDHLGLGAPIFRRVDQPMHNEFCRQAFLLVPFPPSLPSVATERPKQSLHVQTPKQKIATSAC